MMYLLGQFCGVVSTVVTIVRPQLQKKEQMLICGILVNLLSILNFPSSKQVFIG